MLRSKVGRTEGKKKRSVHQYMSSFLPSVRSRLTKENCFKVQP